MSKNLKEHVESLPKTQYRTRLLRVINSCKAFEWVKPLESWTVGDLRCLEKSRYIGKKTMRWLVSNTPTFQKFPVYPEWTLVKADAREESRSYLKDMEYRIRLLLRNALVSKSDITLADCEVLEEIAIRLNYDLHALKNTDIFDPETNPYAKR